MSRKVRLAALGAALTAAVAVPSAAAAAGSVQPTKQRYGLTEPIDISWSVPAGNEVEFWMEPAGSPLVNSPKGSMHFDSAPTGHYALGNPGAGRWEVHWELLGEGVVQRSSAFTVGGSRAAAKVRTGHYGCYTTTTMGLTRSSIDSIDIRPGSRYRAVGGGGRYRYSAGTAKLRIASGPLRRRVARFQPGARPTIIFRRAENERRGKPTIDVSDTYCYFGRS